MQTDQPINFQSLVAKWSSHGEFYYKENLVGNLNREYPLDKANLNNSH